MDSIISLTNIDYMSPKKLGKKLSSQMSIGYGSVIKEEDS